MPLIISRLTACSSTKNFTLVRVFRKISLFFGNIFFKAMYKTRNTGTGNGMQGTRGTRVWGECYIPGNVVKHFGEYRQAFRGMSPNIPGYVLKHSGECPQTFREMSPNFPGDVLKHSGSALKHYGERRQCLMQMKRIIGQSRIQNPVKHPRWSFAAKIANGLNTLTISAKKLHRRYSTGFQMSLRLDVL